MRNYKLKKFLETGIICVFTFIVYILTNNYVQNTIYQDVVTYNVRTEGNCWFAFYVNNVTCNKHMGINKNGGTDDKQKRQIFIKFNTIYIYIWFFYHICIWYS